MQKFSKEQLDQLRKFVKASIDSSQGIVPENPDQYDLEVLTLQLFHFAAHCLSETSAQNTVNTEALDTLAGSFLNRALKHNGKVATAYTQCAHETAQLSLKIRQGNAS